MQLVGYILIQVHILPKYQHITKPTHTHTHTVQKPTHTDTHTVQKSTHTHTHTLQNPHIYKHPHITKQVKTTTVQDTHQIKQSQYNQVPSICTSP